MLRIIIHFPILTSIVVFTIVLNIVKYVTDGKSNNNRQNFLELESKANSTRKKDLSNLNYITINEKNLPLIETNDEIIISSLQRLKILQEKKIVNFTGFTNTELKLEYGVANLPILSEYDSNFTNLCRELNIIGLQLLELGLIKEGQVYLEYAVDVGTDISSTYKALADIYYKNGDLSKISNLKIKANKLGDMNKAIILKALDEFECN